MLHVILFCKKQDEIENIDVLYNRSPLQIIDSAISAHLTEADKFEIENEIEDLVWK